MPPHTQGSLLGNARVSQLESRVKLCNGRLEIPTLRFDSALMNVPEAIVTSAVNGSVRFKADAIVHTRALMAFSWPQLRAMTHCRRG
jgi:hypothetical protein